MTKKASLLSQLKNRKGQAQIDFALELLATKQNLQVTQDALRVLADVPMAENGDQIRATLLRYYHHYAEQGTVRDPGTYKRAIIVQGLRHNALPSDLDLFVQAVETYEFLPPDFHEDGVLLRSAALLAVNELDEQLARFHATRLLADVYTAPMSGEPAITAVRVLGAQDELLPIYYYVMQAEGRTLPDVLAEALNQLVSLPPSLIPGLIERYRETAQDVVLISLFDLLLEHHAGIQGWDFIVDFLRKTRRRAVYRYVVSMIVASSNEALLNDLLEIGRFEQDRNKATILTKALDVVSHVEAVAEFLEIGR